MILKAFHRPTAWEVESIRHAACGLAPHAETLEIRVELFEHQSEYGLHQNVNRCRLPMEGYHIDVVPLHRFTQGFMLSARGRAEIVFFVYDETDRMIFALVAEFDREGLVAVHENAITGSPVWCRLSDGVQDAACTLV